MHFRNLPGEGSLAMKVLSQPARRAGRVLRRVPVLTIALCSMAFLVAAKPNLNSMLACDAPSLLSGQIWRIWTCHLVHWSFDHLAWDVLTLLALGLICEVIDRLRFATTLAISATLIPPVLAMTNPTMVYGGLSGLDIACFTLLVTTVTKQAYQRRDRLMVLAGITFLMGLVAKILFELFTGSTIFVQSADVFVALPLAHMIGAASGFLMVLPGFRIMLRLPQVSIGQGDISPIREQTSIKIGIKSSHQ